MTREVEERLVAMYFDNEDFERNAKQTINTLGQLKQNMNLEESAKGFDVFDKVKRNASMDKLQKSANKLKDTFGTIGTTLTKSISTVGGAPLRAFEGVLSTMRGYISKYLGFDIASKIVGSMENVVRQLTIQPVSQGWNQYESKMDSVKTIMSSTGKSVSEVERHMMQLQTYADKTVYSLNDMTSNLGKFTNNGVELDKATMAIMGVANAAADAGQGTQQASMAMYNISQAIGVGKMTSIDWKSIENANMATKRLKETMIQIAAVRGDLKKVEKEDGTFSYFLTKDKNGKEIKDQKKWTEVTFKNFRETLSEGWLVSDTLVTALQAYSGQWQDIDDLLAAGIDDPELQEYLLKVGKDALEAASQVRTFSKMLSTLKDAVASGWAGTFQHIFGNVEQSTDLWTHLSDEIGGMMNDSAKWRNKLLKDWGDTREVLDYVVRQGDVQDADGVVKRYVLGRNGREILFDTLFQLLDLFKEFKGAIHDAFADVFGLDKLDGKALFKLTQKFEEAVKRIVEWFGKANEEGSRMNKIQRIAKGVFSAFKIGLNILKRIWEIAKGLLGPTFDWLLDIFSRIGDFFVDLAETDPSKILEKIGEKLKVVWTKILKFFTPQALYDANGFKIGEEIPAIKWLKDTWSTLKNTVVSLAQGLGLDGFLSWLGNIWVMIQETWSTAVANIEPVLTVIGEKLGDIWGWIQEILGAAWDFMTKPNEDGSTGFSIWINQVFNAISEAWNWCVGTFTPVFEAIGRFLSDVFGWISNRIGIAWDFMTKPNQDGSTGFSIWISQVFNAISEAWNWCVQAFTPTLEAIGQFLGNIFGWVGEKIGIAWDFMTKPNQDGSTGFSIWISQVFNAISEAWNWCVQTFTPVFEAIGGFFGDIFGWVANLIGTAWDFMTKPNGDGSTGFSIWISQVFEAIKTAWDQCVQVFSPILGTIGGFLGNVWDWIKNTLGVAWDFMTKPNPDGTTGFSVWINQVFDAIGKAWNWAVTAFTPTLETIGQFFGDIFGWVANLIGAAWNFMTKPNEDGSTGFSVWISQVFNAISEAWDWCVATFTPVFQTIGGFLSDVWGWISNALGIAVDFMTKPNPDGTTGFSVWINQVFDAIGKAWNWGVQTFGPVLEKIGAFLGNVWGWITQQFNAAWNYMAEPDGNGETGFSKWLGKVWDALQYAWDWGVENLSWLFEDIGRFLSDTWGWIMKTFGGSGGEGNEDGIASATESFDDVSSEGAELNEAATSASSIFTQVINVISGFIDKISEFFASTSGLGLDLSGVGTFLNGVGTFINGVLDTIGKILGYIGNYLVGDWTDEAKAKEGEEAIRRVLRILEDIVLLFTGSSALRIAEAAVLDALDYHSIGEEIRDACMGVMFIFGTVVALKLANVGQEDLALYAPWIMSALTVIGIIMMALSHFSENVATTAGTFNGTKVLTRLISSIERIGMIAVVMALLPNVIDAIADAKAKTGGAVIGMDVIETLAGIGILVAEMSVIVGIVSAVSSVLPLSGMGKGAVVIMLAIGILTGILAMIDNMIPDSDRAQQLSEKASKVRDAVKDVIGIILDIPRELGKSAGDMIGGFVEGVGAGVGNARRAITGEQTDSEKAAQEASIWQANLEASVEALLKISEVLDINKLQAISEMVNNIDELAQNLVDQAYVTHFDSFATSLFTMVNSISDLLNRLVNSKEIRDFEMNDETHAVILRIFDDVGYVFGMFDEITPTTFALLSDTEGFKNFFENITRLTLQSSRVNNGVSYFEAFIADVQSIMWDLKNYRSVEYDKFELDSIEGTIGAIHVLSGMLNDLASACNSLDRIEAQYKMAVDRYSAYDMDLYISDIGMYIEGMLLAMQKVFNIVNSHTELADAGRGKAYDMLAGITSVLGLFGEDGIGSALWDTNFEAFRKTIDSTDFIEKYIGSIEKIYDALRESSLSKDEGITFNGVKIVERLFEAIQEGFDSGEVPSIDATVVVDSIVTAIGLGKTAIAQAIHDMIQAGVDQTNWELNPQNGGATVTVTPQVTLTPEQQKMYDDLMGMWSDPTKLKEYVGQWTGDYSSIFDEQFGGLLNMFDESNPDSYFGKIMSADDKLQSAMTGLSNTLSGNFLTLTNEKGEAVDFLEYFGGTMDQLAEKANGMEAIKIKIQPVFDLEQFTQDKLQEQLSKYKLNVPANIGLPNVSVDLAGLRSALEIDSINAKLDAIKLAIDLWGSSNVSETATLGTHMDGVASSIGNVRLVLDTGVLVGQILPQIDVGLYNRALAKSRRGAVNMNQPHFVY